MGGQSPYRKGPANNPAKDPQKSFVAKFVIGRIFRPFGRATQHQYRTSMALPAIPLRRPTNEPIRESSCSCNQRGRLRRCTSPRRLDQARGYMVLPHPAGPDHSRTSTHSRTWTAFRVIPRSSGQVAALHPGDFSTSMEEGQTSRGAQELGASPARSPSRCACRRRLSRGLRSPLPAGAHPLG